MRSSTSSKRICALTVAVAAVCVCARASHQSDVYSISVDSAINCIKDGKPAEAEEILLKTLRANPADARNAMLLSNLSEAQRLTGKCHDAEQSCAIGLIRFPNSSVLHLNRAKALLCINEETGAIEELNTTLSIDSVNTSALSILTALALKKGDFKSAYTFSRRLTETDPADSFGWYAKAEAMAGLFDGDKNFFSEIEKSYTKAIELEDDLQTYVSFASWLLQNREDAKASEVISKAIATYPHEPFPYLLRALLHKQRYENEACNLDIKSARALGATQQQINAVFPSH